MSEQGYLEAGADAKAAQLLLRLEKHPPSFFFVTLMPRVERHKSLCALTTSPPTRLYPYDISLGHRSFTAYGGQRSPTADGGQYRRINYPEFGEFRK